MKTRIKRIYNGVIRFFRKIFFGKRLDVITFYSKIKFLFTSYDNYWRILGRVGIVLGIIGFFLTVLQVIPDIKETKSDIEFIQDQLADKNAESTLYRYFYLIEQGEFEEAFTLFTEKKKEGHSLQGFKDWLNNFVAFEGLKLTELEEKRSASKRVFLMEADFKKRGMKPVGVKWGFTMIYKNNEWKIDYTNVLYEKGYKEGACEFYKFEDYCN